MLHTIHKIFAKSEVKQIREGIDQAAWQDGKQSAGGHALLVKNNRQLDEQSDITLKYGQLIIERLNQHPVFIAAALPKKISPPKFNQYSDGGYYGPHVDKSVMFVDQNDYIRTDISATLFLSEPREYQGGELVIETGYGPEEFKLASGDMILYPSSYIHEVRSVTQGARIAAFFWVESFVGSSERRAMLFDLDQSIQRFSCELGSQDNEVKKLILLYHNLVRMWAHT
ncbi:Fe2+-dependent dioxygenase [Exilibacterium tricleocarpae]|uniref:Fe2+-dependent dioxygenase n=1 Tax=Exilibacterium tricleocarpae TaxID=2591008 RepID=A0A545TZ21_9GAMM|nr:Fe2+-dependent dioxygenase [Exilibacterium tricleocarpae]TQV82472.1 Fe2+-dependent dioxygenase [Exilibacterium tricleocarpae]